MRKFLKGVVINNSFSKTIVVRVILKKIKKKYPKTVNISKKYLVHDANNVCKLGDLVNIVECRPLSRLKKWIFFNNNCLLK